MALLLSTLLIHWLVSMVITNDSVQAEPLNAHQHVWHANLISLSYV